MSRQSNVSFANRVKEKALLDAAITQFVAASGTKTDVDYYLKFETIGWVRFASAADGWGLSFRIGESPDGYSIQELGHVAVVPAALDSRFAACIGQVVTDAELMVLPQSADPIGLKLLWNNRYLFIYNWGDQVQAKSEWPEYLVEVNARSQATD